MEVQQLSDGEAIELKALMDEWMDLEKKAWFGRGKILIRIQEKKLYRAKYKTFEKFCSAALEVTARYAYLTINSYLAAINVNNCSQKQIREGQARPLAKLPPDKQPVAWKMAEEMARKRGGALKARYVDVAVKEVAKQMAKAESGNTAATQDQPELDVSIKVAYVLEEWNAMTKEQQKKILQWNPKWESNFNMPNDNIKWAKWSWNPVTGCLHTCKYCYARDIANRFYDHGFKPAIHPSRLIAPVKTKPKELGDKLDYVERMGWKNVFVCSMADLFGKWVPVEWIDAVLNVVRKNTQWNYLFLTKYPERMAEFEFPDHAWTGATVDRQASVERTEKAFRKIKAKIKWLSCEPMLERLEFSDLSMFNWIVYGGNSGNSETKPFIPLYDWWDALDKQAAKHGIPIYQKTNLLREEYPSVK